MKDWRWERWRFEESLEAKGSAWAPDTVWVGNWTSHRHHPCPPPKGSNTSPTWVKSEQLWKESDLESLGGEAATVRAHLSNLSWNGPTCPGPVDLMGLLCWEA